LRDNSNTEVLLRDKKDVSSLHDLLLNEEGKDRSQDKEDFLKIMREIKREEAEEKPIDEYEGGSDSESEGEDLEE
jgi:hypothetical protein